MRPASEVAEADVITIEVPKSRIVTVSAKITYEEFELLQAISRECGISRSSLIRLALQAALAQLAAAGLGAGARPADGSIDGGALSRLAEACGKRSEPK